MSTSPATESVSELARFARYGQAHLTTDDYLRLERKRLLTRIAWGVVFALVTGGTLALAPEGIAFALPFLMLLCFVLPIVLWHYPRAILYITVSAVCLVELLPLAQPDSITDRIPFFWNVNSIFQTYAHLNIKAVPLNLFECILILAGVCSLFRAVFSGNAKVTLGPLFWPIAAYLIFVVIAFVNGMATGGDFKIALQETRAQFYFMIAYLMAVNLVTTRRHVDTLLCIIAISIAFKGLLYTLRRYVTLHGLPLSDQGVGSHEEAFFFDCFECLLVSLLICGSRPKLRNFMLWTLPLVILGNLATNRRAGTAAIAILVPVVFLAAYQGFPERRRIIAVIGITFAILGTAYYQAFKTSESAVAQPARAIHSQFQPDARDASSNQYRDAENADQMATIRANPLGFGYGKHFLHVVPIADISSMYEWWDLMPHNNVLWVWMRTGALGVFSFWIMVACITIRSTMCFRDQDLNVDLRVVALFAVVVLGSLLVFGLLDLQLINFRDMVFAALICGMTASVEGLKKPGLASLAGKIGTRTWATSGLNKKAGL